MLKNLEHCQNCKIKCSNRCITSEVILHTIEGNFTRDCMRSDLTYSGVPPSREPEVGQTFSCLSKLGGTTNFNTVPL